MLTVFVLTVVLTACAVLGDENYCNLDLAQTLCMENFNLTKVGGKLVTMMMVMIITSTKMMVVVMVIIIMMVMVIMLMLIVLVMVAMVVGMLLLVGVMLQMAMVVIAMITIRIFMMAMITKRKRNICTPVRSQNTDFVLIETFKCCMYNLFPSLSVCFVKIYMRFMYIRTKLQTFIRMSMGAGGGGGRWVGRGATLHELLNVNIMHDSLYSCKFICPLFADALYECNGTKTYFSSVQFKMVSMSSEKPICAPLSL